MSVLLLYCRYYRSVRAGYYWVELQLNPILTSKHLCHCYVWNTIYSAMKMSKLNLSISQANDHFNCFFLQCSLTGTRCHVSNGAMGPKMLPFSHTIWFTGFGDTGDKWWIKSHNFINNWIWHSCAPQLQMLQNGALNSQHSVLLCKAKNDKNLPRPFELFIIFCLISGERGESKSGPKIWSQIKQGGKIIHEPNNLFMYLGMIQIWINNKAKHNNYKALLILYSIQHSTNRQAHGAHKCTLC